MPTLSTFSKSNTARDAFCASGTSPTNPNVLINASALFLSLNQLKKISTPSTYPPDNPPNKTLSILTITA